MKKKHALIIGCGASGRAAAAFLLDRGWAVDAFDDRKEQIERLPDFFPLAARGVQLIPHNAIAADCSYHLAILSPGIPPSHPIIQLMKNHQVEIIGEVELAARHIKNRCLGITGTNGKTTVTLLVDHILKLSGRNSSAVGNVGIPLTAQVASLQHQADHIFVIELSSFQLETLTTPLLDAAAVLNITPDHLDRYPSMEEYARSKSLIVNVLKDGGCCYASEQAARWMDELGVSTRVKRYGFSADCSIFCDQEKIVVNEKVEDILPLRYRGSKNHDIENALAAFALCREVGVTFKQFCEGLSTFQKPPHRIEFVRKLDGISYYDDSKGTNIDAVEKAVASMPGNVVLIAGGVHKGASYRPWLKTFQGKVKQVYAIGQAAELICTDLSDLLPVAVCADLNEAVRRAQKIAREGENVLLAPGCSSYDQFRDYAHRGEVFQSLVHELKSEGKL